MGADKRKNPETTTLQARIIEVLRTCHDPEIPVNIHELGLIYGIDINPAGSVTIRMTLTAPNCPVAGKLPAEVKSKVGELPGVTDVRVELVWDPPWSVDKMSEAARLQLGLGPLDRSSRNLEV